MKKNRRRGKRGRRNRSRRRKGDFKARTNTKRPGKISKMTQLERKTEKRRQRKKKVEKKRREKKTTQRKKQMKKRTKNMRKERKMNRQTDDTVSGACLERSATIMRMWKDIVTNFEKQRKRIERQTGAGDSKKGKKEVFNPVANRLLEIGGGQKSKLSCGDSTDNAGAKQLLNLTNTLFACEENLQAACSFDSARKKVNETAINNCNELAKNFRLKAQECLNKTIGETKTSPADACNCWTTDELEKVANAVSKCKFNTEANAIRDTLKKCTDTFRQCRKYEDEAVTSIMACNFDTEKLEQTVVEHPLRGTTL